MSARRGKLLVVFGLQLALLLVIVGLVSAQTSNEAASAPLGTGFTYQGRLIDAGGPVTGTCDLVFRLYDQAATGTLLGTEPLSGVSISDGYFAVALDFGAMAFSGEARWLEIDVDCGGGAVTLSPRQELTAAPYAHYARGAPWSGLSGVPADLLDGDADTTYAAGSGLTLLGDELSVNFAGTGSANTAAHSDHDHFGATWSGAGVGLTVSGNPTGIEATGNWTGVSGAGLAAGVFGSSTDLYGVFGEATGVSGRGVYGWATDTGGLNYGVYGESSSSVGYGVFGEGRTGVKGKGNPGVVGESSQGDGVVGNASQPDKSGVYGYNSSSGYGVFGRSQDGVGVSGKHAPSGNIGELGTAEAGVTGESANGRGVEGFSSSASEWAPAVYGSHDGAGDGVYGVSQNRHGVYGVSKSSDAAGVYARNDDGGAAIQSDGDLYVTGAYRGDLGPNGGAPFPRPAYDSGWIAIDRGARSCLNHRVGGNVDNYVVVMDHRASWGSFIYNNMEHGMMFQGSDQMGFWWLELTNEWITLMRGKDDGVAEVMEYRVRIWAYP